MRYSVDAICTFKGKFVLVERLSFPFGLAFPGGGIEEGEDKITTVIREMKEETGLDFTPTHFLPRVYDKEGRDPRWPATSYVAVGEGEGSLSNEEGKTKVVLLSCEEILMRENEFVFDHYEIFCDYVNSR